MKEVKVYDVGEEGDASVNYIDCTTDRILYETAIEVINNGLVKDLYIHNHELVRVEHREDRFGKYVSMKQVNRHMLGTMLMNSVPVYRNRKDNKIDEVPKPSVMEQVLANQTSEFYGIPIIEEIVNVPLLLPNRTFLSKPGYDPATKTYYAPLDTEYRVPKNGDTKLAKQYLLDSVLGDFPWITTADKTNALAYLVTQVIKGAYNFLIPLAFITSPQAGSGKTLIADLNLEIFGGVRKSFPNDEQELRKTIFSALRTPTSTIVFDNVDTGSTLKSPYLAEILTSRRHTDRILGQSEDIEVTNGRIWMATGNNLNIGGDLATRIVPIRIDPNMPNPEKRDGFKLDLSRLSAATKQDVYESLVILIQDWLNKGAKEKHTPMRTFTPWASTLKGFMEHHDIPHFLGNVDEVISDADEEKNNNETLLFLAREIFGDQWWTTQDLRQKAIGQMNQTEKGKWTIEFPNVALKDYLPCDRDGGIANMQTVGRYLGKIKGTHFGPYKLEYHKDKRTKQSSYHVLKKEVEQVFDG